MKSSNDNIHTALAIVQDKKLRIQALGRRAHLKSKLHFPSQADCNWKPINTFTMHLKRQMKAASVHELVPNMKTIA